MVNTQTGYYYLPRAKATGIRLTELKNDLKRGVRRLSEDSYMMVYGSTVSSMDFAMVLMSLLGEQFLRSKKAELRFSKKHWYTLHLYTEGDYEIVFKGVSGGYWGEGSRGCHDLLKVAGFSDKQCQYPFQKESFMCTRKQ